MSLLLVKRFDRDRRLVLFSFRQLLFRFPLIPLHHYVLIEMTRSIVLDHLG